MYLQMVIPVYIGLIFIIKVLKTIFFGNTIFLSNSLYPLWAKLNIYGKILLFLLIAISMVAEIPGISMRLYLTGKVNHIIYNKCISKARSILKDTFFEKEDGQP